jgi:hypothetical protein
MEKRNIMKGKLSHLLVLLLLYVFSMPVFGQNTSPSAESCEQLNFDLLGDLKLSWKKYYQDNSMSARLQYVSNSDADYTTWYNNNKFNYINDDEIYDRVLDTVLVNPNGNNFVMLGMEPNGNYTGTGLVAEIEFEFTPTRDDYVFEYSYYNVFLGIDPTDEDFSDLDDYPYFEVEIFKEDANGVYQPLANGMHNIKEWGRRDNYNLSYGVTYDGWKPLAMATFPPNTPKIYSIGHSKEWTTNKLYFNNEIGSYFTGANLKIRFKQAFCKKDNHWSYSYIDAACNGVISIDTTNSDFYYCDVLGFRDYFYFGKYWHKFYQHDGMSSRTQIGNYGQPNYLMDDKINKYLYIESDKIKDKILDIDITNPHGNNFIRLSKPSSTSNPDDKSLVTDIEFTFYTSHEYTNFQYSYYNVFEDVNPDDNDVLNSDTYPYFEVEVLIDNLDGTYSPFPTNEFYVKEWGAKYNTNLVYDVNYEYYVNQDPQNSQIQLATGVYGHSREWITNTLDFSNYLGYNVLIRFRQAYEKDGYKFGYTYIDMECTETGITDDNTPSETICEQINLDKRGDLISVWDKYYKVKGMSDRARYNNNNSNYYTLDNNYNKFHYIESDRIIDRALDSTIINPQGNNFMRLSKMTGNSNSEIGLQLDVEYNITPAYGKSVFEYSYFNVVEDISSIRYDSDEPVLGTDDYPLFEVDVLYDYGNGTYSPVSSATFNVKEWGRKDNPNLIFKPTVISEVDPVNGEIALTTMSIGHSINWQTNTIDLSDYIGANLVIRFRQAYHKNSSKFGYSYIDVKCTETYGSDDTTSSSDLCNQFSFDKRGDLMFVWDKYYKIPGMQTRQSYSSNNIADYSVDNDINKFLFIESDKFYDKVFDTTLTNPMGANFIRLSKTTKENSNDAGLEVEMEYTYTPTCFNSSYKYNYYNIVKGIEPLEYEFGQWDLYPYFEVDVYKVNNGVYQQIGNGDFYLKEVLRPGNPNLVFIYSAWAEPEPGSNILFPKTSSIGRSIVWNTKTIDLKDYIGEEVVIRFKQTYCKYDYHFAYTYIDAECVDTPAGCGNVTPSDNLCEQFAFDEKGDLMTSWNKYYQNKGMSSRGAYNSVSSSDYTIDNADNKFHFIESDKIFDKVLNEDITNPTGGNFVRINKITNGEESDRGLALDLEYEFSPSNQQYLFEYVYYNVFAKIKQGENDADLYDDYPYFEVDVLKEISGGSYTTVNSGVFNVKEWGKSSNNNIEFDREYANPNTSGNNVDSIGHSKEWMYKTLDLSDYIGENLIIRFKQAYCKNDFHYSYSYLDAYCKEDTIVDNGDPSETLCAQFGFDKKEDVMLSWNKYFRYNRQTERSEYNSASSSDYTTDNEENKYHYIETDRIFDKVLNEEIVNPNGENFVRLNKITNGESHNMGLVVDLEYEFSPSNQQYLFEYFYYNVFTKIEANDDDYDLDNEYPYFEVDILKVLPNGGGFQQLNSGEFYVKEWGRDNDNITFDRQYTNPHKATDNIDSIGHSTEWKHNTIDLENYIGENLVIRFRQAYCARGHHYSYSYIDANCAELDGGTGGNSPSANLCAKVSFEKRGDLMSVWDKHYQNADMANRQQYSSIQSADYTSDDEFTMFHYINSDKIFDQVIKQHLTNPNGNNFIKLNKVTNGQNSDRGLSVEVEFKFTPTQNQQAFEYYYYNIFSMLGDFDNDHIDPGQSPTFEVDVYQISNDQYLSLDNGRFKTTEIGEQNNSQLEFVNTYENNGNNYDIGNSKQWQTRTINLQDFIGQEVIIRFKQTYCQEGHHFAYSYIDVKCIDNLCRVKCDEKVSLDACTNQFVFPPLMENCFANVEITSEQWDAPNASYASINPPKFMYSTPGLKNINHVVHYTQDGQNCSIVLPVKVGVSNCPPPDNTCCESSFSPEPGKMYLVSGWCKEDLSYPTAAYANPIIAITYYLDGGELFDTLRTSGLIVEEWQKIEQAIQIPAYTKSIEVELVNLGNNQIYFDDIRFQPFNSQLKTFVYDPITKRLMAEHDENNFSTYYEYDEEGNLQRIKKETARGIQTIQEGRQNLIKK